MANKAQRYVEEVNPYFEKNKRRMRRYLNKKYRQKRERELRREIASLEHAASDFWSAEDR